MLKKKNDIQLKVASLYFARWCFLKNKFVRKDKFRFNARVKRDIASWLPVFERSFLVFWSKETWKFQFDRIILVRFLVSVSTKYSQIYIYFLMKALPLLIQRANVLFGSISGTKASSTWNEIWLTAQLVNVTADGLLYFIFPLKLAFGKKQSLDKKDVFTGRWQCLNRRHDKS